MNLYICLCLWLFFGLSIELLPLIYDHSLPKLKSTFVGLLMSISACMAFGARNYTILFFYCLIFVLLGAYSLLKFGIFDARFAAKKFVYYHVLALILLCFGGLLDPSSSLKFLSITLAAFIMLAGYFGHGWFEPFCMHAPVGLLITYSAFFYPSIMTLINAVFSETINIYKYTGLQNFCFVVGTIGAILSSILFFARTENRRFWAYLVTWSTSIFLLLSYCARGWDVTTLTIFPFVQGITLALLIHCFVYLQVKLNHDKLISFKEASSTNKFCSFAVKSLLILLGIISLVGMIIVRPSILISTIILFSLILYIIFVKNLFQNHPEKNYLSFK